MEIEETRVVNGQWELSGFGFRIEAGGWKLATESMKEGKFTGVKCHECGMVYLPGAFYCRKCHIKIDEPAGVSDHGTIMSRIEDADDAVADAMIGFIQAHNPSAAHSSGAAVGSTR